MVMEKIELVEIENLSYRYPGSDQAALSQVSLRLYPGEFVLLVGASGCGKSTLCRAINGLVPHFYGGNISGNVKVVGLDTVSTDVRTLARTVGMVFQNPENQIVTESAVSEVAFGLENLGVARPQMRKRVEEVLAGLRLSELREKSVSELSGGQKQKLVLASALAMQPQILVLDEPTSQLDPISAEEFLSTLKSLNDELGLMVLLAEHRVERCFHFADRVVVLEDGRTVFVGEPSALPGWSRGRTWVPLPPVTRLFMGEENGNVPLTVKEGRIKVAEIAGAGGVASVPDIRDTPRETRSSSLKGKGHSESPECAVETRNLWHVYDDGTQALRGVDLVIEPGECVAVIGENGSGKTTLVKHFNGLLRPSKGQVLVRGRDAKDQEVADLARTCGMLGQNPNLQLIADTVAEELEISLKAMDVPRASRVRTIEETLDAFDLTRYRELDPQELSCGQRELLALASVLVYRPGILVMDEPTRGIDMSTKDRLSAYLRSYNRDGNTVILVTHDLEFAAECCTRVVLMGNGQVLADGDKHDILTDSLFFTTQYNRCFRGVVDGVVTREDALRAVEVMR
jgi:energy-coupling factor transport system ATP-binding protein